ncbi:MAG: acyl carrier protein [Clostridia bacterium]|nr:acyl carrier protein [Clostridia bacterium]
MSDNEMLEKLREVICEFVDLKPGDITLETNVRNDLGMNSLELINMAVAIEDEFGVEIPDRAASGLETIGDAIDIIKEYME